MWCHLCKTDFTDYEDFKVHILKFHRCEEEFYKNDSDSEESKEENTETSEFEESKSNEFFNKNAAKLTSDADSEDFSSKSDISRSSKARARKKKKYSLRKRMPSRRKKVPTSYQDYSSEHSDDIMSDISESSTKRNNDQTTVNSQSAVNNNQVYFVNQCNDQDINSYVMRNQKVQQPVLVLNKFAANPSQLNKSFDFSSQNISKWLAVYKELCKDVKFPMPPSLFHQIKSVRKGIYDNYCMIRSREETGAVLMVFVELNRMLFKHITQINEQL